MVFVSVQCGSKAVQVRVDDLPMLEREFVNGTIECVQRIVNRREAPMFPAMLAMLCGGFTTSVVLRGLSVALIVFFSLGIAGFVSILTWIIAKEFVDRRNKKDAGALQEIMVHSPRAQEFVATFNRLVPEVGLAKLIQLPLPGEDVAPDPA